MSRRSISITIQPMFWVTASLLAWLGGSSLERFPVWLGIIFVSVLVHELGHALAALGFGLKPRIELVALGGVTYHEGHTLSLPKQFVVVLMGPLFGLMLFGAATLLLQLPLPDWSHYSLRILQMINLFWAILNLLPVLPMDGGQLLRILLQGLFGEGGVRAALWIGAVVGVVLTAFALWAQQLFIGALFILFAFQNFEQLRAARMLRPSDWKEDLRAELSRAEEDLAAGNRHSAEQRLERILFKASSERGPGSGMGVLCQIASHTLAALAADEKDWTKVYQLLRPLGSALSPQGMLLLHEAAFVRGDYPLVVQLGGECYRIAPSSELALRTAKASAQLGEVRAALGWLESVWQQGIDLGGELLADPLFDTIRSDPLFQDFIKRFATTP